MEQILWLYALSYDPLYPVICFDERPCFLIGDVVEPLAMQCGQVRKEHYAYTKHGSCALLAAIEPLTGNRLAHVQPRRTKREFALFCQALAMAYPEAIKIRLVLDNLNTHHYHSLVEYFGKVEADRIMNRLCFHFTPPHGSWLNMAEIEIGVMAEQCLKRRLADEWILQQELIAWEEARNNEKRTIHWTFTVDKAREVFAKYYTANLTC